MHAQVPSPSRSRRTRAYVRTESQTVRRSIDRAPHPSINSLAPRKSYSTPRPAIGIYVGSRHPVHGRRQRRLGMPLYRWTRRALLLLLLVALAIAVFSARAARPCLDDGVRLRTNPGFNFSAAVDGQRFAKLAAEKDDWQPAPAYSITRISDFLLEKEGPAYVVAVAML